MHDVISKIGKYIERIYKKKILHEEIMRKIKPEDPVEGLYVSRALAVLHCKANGMNEDEIAEKLKISKNRVKRLYNYGTKRLVE